MVYLRGGDADWNEYEVSVDDKRVTCDWLAVDEELGLVFGLADDNHLVVIRGKVQVRRLAERGARVDHS